MKKRLKIILTAIAMCVIIGTGAYGVYALSTVSVTYNTSIGFNATIAQIALKASVTGNEGTAIADCYYDPMNHYTSSEKTGATILSSLDSPWNIGNLAFSSNRDDIVITVSLTNLSNEEISSYVTTTSTLTNVTVDYTQAMNIATDVTKDAVVTISLDTLSSFSGLTLNFTMDIYDNATGAQTFHADPDFLAPNTLSGLTYSSSGSTRTWSNGSTQVFRVVSSTSGTTVTETNTYTAGGKTTTFTTTYNTSTAAGTVNNYPIYDRTLVSITGGNGNYIMPNWLNLVTIGEGGSGSSATLFASAEQDLVRKLFLPSTVQAISSYAIYDFDNLSYLDLCEGLVEVESNAIYQCHSFFKLTVPSTLTTVGSWGFGNLSGLAEIYNLSNLNITVGSTDNGNIGQFAIVVYDSLETPSKIIKSNNVYYYVDGSEKIAVRPEIGATSVRLDEDTTKIKGSAFRFSDVEYVHIPEGVTEIGNAAFAVSALRSIVIPSSVTTLGTGFFTMCNRLTSVTLLSQNITTIPRTFLSMCGSITTFEIPESVTTIDSGAFTTTGLSSITIPAGVTTIASNAFGSCSNLTEVTINSPTIARGITSLSTSVCGGLLNNAQTVRIPTSISTLGAGITSNFTLTGTVDGYKIYERNS